jgi:hypothetical protein
MNLMNSWAQDHLRIGEYLIEKYDPILVPMEENTTYETTLQFPKSREALEPLDGIVSVNMQSAINEHP